MTKHKHSEILLALANGQQVQFMSEDHDNWIDWPKIYHKGFSPLFCAETTKWRVKPSTIRIGDVDVPEPMRVAPEIGSTYFSSVADDECLFSELAWANDPYDNRLFSRSLCHSTREAAIAHSKAFILLSGGKL